MLILRWRLMNPSEPVSTLNLAPPEVVIAAHSWKCLRSFFLGVPLTSPIRPLTGTYWWIASLSDRSFTQSSKLAATKSSIADAPLLDTRCRSRSVIDTLVAWRPRSLFASVSLRRTLYFLCPKVSGLGNPPLIDRLQRDP